MNISSIIVSVLAAADWYWEQQYAPFFLRGIAEVEYDTRNRELEYFAYDDDDGIINF